MAPQSHRAVGRRGNDQVLTFNKVQADDWRQMCTENSDKRGRLAVVLLLVLFNGREDFLETCPALVRTKRRLLLLSLDAIRRDVPHLGVKQTRFRVHRRLVRGGERFWRAWEDLLHARTQSRKERNWPGLGPL